MIFDNQIIIDFNKRTSPVFKLEPGEPSVLIKLKHKSIHEEVTIKLKRTEGQSVRTDVVLISYDYVKFRIEPFDSFFLELEFPKREGACAFDIVTGTNLELLIFELDKNYSDLQSHAENREFNYFIGCKTFSYLSVKKISENYFLDLCINTKQLNYKKNFQLESIKPVTKQLTALNHSLKIMQEHFSETDLRKKQLGKVDPKFDAIINKHFNPKFG